MKEEISVLKCFSGVGKTSGRPFNILTVMIGGEVGKLFSDVPAQPGKYDAIFVWTTDQNLNLSVKVVALE